ncbi:MAG: hypothetical protein AB7L09_02685 [Nitrospira sp.]
MPKYVEERDLAPVAGAFGITQRLIEWARDNRADSRFCDGTGPYRNCLRIGVTEEYGYREWMWTYPGTVDELIADWVAGRRPIGHSYDYWSTHGRQPTYQGSSDRITWYARECKREPDPIYREFAGESGIVDHPFLVETGQPVFCVRGYDGWHGTAHVHEDDDSELDIDFYRVSGLTNPIVKVMPDRVLRSLSQIG